MLNKINKEDISLILATFAILVSIWTFAKTQGLAEKEYQLKLTPQLLVETKYATSKKDVTIALKNAGSETIHDVKINYGSIVILGDNNRIGASTLPKRNQIYTKYWKRINKLDSGAVKTITVDYADFLNTYKFYEFSLKLSETEEEGNVFHVFFIKYCREPDNKEYDIKKYILVQKDNHDELIMTDLDFLSDFNPEGESIMKLLNKRFDNTN